MPAADSARIDFDARLRRIWESPADLGPARRGSDQPAGGAGGGSGDFLEAFVEEIADDGHAPWEGFLYDVGFEWGLVEFEEAARRARGDDPLPRWGAGRLMETWWAAAAAADWGIWRPDFRYWKRGAVLVAAESRGRIPDAVSTGLFAALFSATARRPLAAIPWVHGPGGRWILASPAPQVLGRELAPPGDSGLPPAAEPPQERGSPRLPEGFWKALEAVLAGKYGSAAEEVQRRIGGAWGRRSALRFEQEFAGRQDGAGMWDASLEEISAAWDAFFERDGLCGLGLDFSRRDRGLVEASLAPPGDAEGRALDSPAFIPLWEGFLGEFFAAFTGEALAARRAPGGTATGERRLLLTSAARLSRVAASESAPEAFLGELLETEA